MPHTDQNKKEACLVSAVNTNPTHGSSSLWEMPITRLTTNEAKLVKIAYAGVEKIRSIFEIPLFG